MKRRTLLLFFFSSFLPSLFLQPVIAGAQNLTDFLPLQVGNVWVYHPINATAMKTFTITLVLSLFVPTFAQYQPWGEMTPQPTTGALYSGSVTAWPGPQSLWVCGDSGMVFKSLNPWGGNPNWRTVNFGIPSTVTLVNMCAYDSSLALVAGYTTMSTMVYRTSNGGYNWTQVFSQMSGSINGVWFKNSSTAIMIGNPVGGRWTIFRSTNGGLTWDSAGRRLVQSGSETGFNNSIYCQGDSVWFGTNNYRIYYSSNYGLNWIAQSTGSMQNVYSFYFDQWCWGYCYGLAGGSTLLQTTNYGLNWTQVSNVQGSGNIIGITAGDPGVLDDWPYFYARGNMIYNNTGGWVLNYTAPSGIYTYMFRYVRIPYNYSGKYAVRNNGGVSWCACVFGKVQKNGSEIPESFRLYQNFPNPFNASSLIKFDIPAVPLNKRGERRLSVKLVIFDIIGKEVQTLLDELLQPGSYEASWNADNYPSGIYYYKLTVGDYTETKKAVLIK